MVQMGARVQRMQATGRLMLRIPEDGFRIAEEEHRRAQLLPTWTGCPLVLQGGQVELQDHSQQIATEDRELHGGMKRPRVKQVVEQGGAEVSSLYPPIH